MKPALMRHTEQGLVTDPNHPAKRLEVERGVYVTADPEEIEFLKAHPCFGQKGPDGFSLLRKVTPQEQVEALMKTGLTRKQILEAMDSEG
jgi:hypothetical protein